MMRSKEEQDLILLMRDEAKSAVTDALAAIVADTYKAGIEQPRPGYWSMRLANLFCAAINRIVDEEINQ